MSDNANTNDQDPRPEYHEIPADHILEVSPYLPLDRSQEHGNDSATRLDPTSIQQNEASIASATESSVYAGGNTPTRPFAEVDGPARSGTSETSNGCVPTKETESATASYESGGSNDDRPLPDGDPSPTPVFGTICWSSRDPSCGERVSESYEYEGVGRVIKNGGYTSNYTDVKYPSLSLSISYLRSSLQIGEYGSRHSLRIIRIKRLLGIGRVPQVCTHLCDWQLLREQ